MPGTLFLVATPIGNLADFSQRAIDTLKQADLIACEDTRQTAKLLDAHGISKPMRSYHDYNEVDRAAELVDELVAGRSIALVSDGGTPLVSDPGYRLVRAAVAEGAPVIPIPGASAVISALSASGLPTDAFYFGGFLPSKPGQRKTALSAVAAIPATLVFYEAPHRILETLADIRDVLGDRPCAVARELTKLHEEILRGRTSEVAKILTARATIKGEITIVIDRASPESLPVASGDLAEEVAALVGAGEDRMEAIKAVAKRHNIGKREVYKALNP